MADTEAAAAETPKTDSRVKVLNVPETLKHPIDLSEENLKKLAAGKTKTQPRAEFIRELWATRQYSRSDILKCVRVFGSDPEVKYQIIFQATKGHEGGPEAKAAAEEGAAAE